MENGDTTSTFGETNLKIICHGSASELNFLILERKIFCEELTGSKQTKLM